MGMKSVPLLRVCQQCFCRTAEKVCPHCQTDLWLVDWETFCARMPPNPIPKPPSQGPPDQQDLFPEGGVV